LQRWEIPQDVTAEVAPELQRLRKMLRADDAGHSRYLFEVSCGSIIARNKGGTTEAHPFVLCDARIFFVYESRHRNRSWKARVSSWMR
jgi:hypothetical protein